MTDRENFLERWSRRKREAVEPADEPQAPISTGEGAPSGPSAWRDQGDEDKTKPAQMPAQKPEFDLASLPPIESITATTDVRAFLAPGVPPELTRAALRRAWEADPAIRNFVGLQENDWDFTNPNAMAGFGDLPPGIDLKSMVARLFGEVESAAEATSPADQSAPAATVPSQIPQRAQPHGGEPSSTSSARPQSPDDAAADQTAAGTAEPGLERAEFVQDNKNIATQNKSSDRRKHGGALPE